MPIKTQPTQATKILWGQIIIVSLVVVGFIWTATQWTAWRLGFQPQLGAPTTAEHLHSLMKEKGLVLKSEL